MPVSLYDVLDVDPGASAEEIRAAWRVAIADLDPADRRFRAFNQAAETLLDPTRRAAYADTLEAPAAPEISETSAAPEPADDPEAEAEDGAGTGPRRTLRSRRSLPLPRLRGRPVRRTPGAGAAPSPRILGLLALATLATVVAAACVWYFRPADAAVDRATAEAQRAAERAATTILSYDHSRLDADHDASVAFMTEDYQRIYDPLFATIEENAPGLKVTVAAELVASGVIRVGAGREADDRVQVLVVVDQTVTNRHVTDPVTLPAFATLTMQRVDGEWLVDDIVGPPIPDAP